MNEFFKKPVVKILMLKGEKGDKGDTGTGTPTGGKTGQYLQKKSDSDYDYSWSAITTVNWENVTGKPSAYPTTWDNVSGKPSTYPSTWGEVTGKPATYPSTWNTVSGKPSTFAPTPSVTKSLTLTAASWSNGSYTISDSLITTSSNQEIIPAVGITADQLKALQKAMIVDGGQSTGSITLTALGTVPTIDIPIRVIFRGTI